MCVCVCVVYCVCGMCVCVCVVCGMCVCVCNLCKSGKDVQYFYNHSLGHSRTVASVPVIPGYPRNGCGSTDSSGTGERNKKKNDF